MNNLTQRILTGVVGAAVIIFLLCWHAWSLTILFLLLAMFTQFEFLRVVNKLKEKADSPAHIYGNLFAGLLNFLLITGSMAGWLPGMAWTGTLPILAAIFLLELYQDRPNPFQHIGFRLTGQIYIILPFAWMAVLGTAGNCFQYLYPMGVLFIIWTNDVFAYFTGRLLGRNRLFPRISPAKTWEGFIGGVIMALVCASIFDHFDQNQPLFVWLVLGFLLAVVGTGGDLVESLLKRNLQMKDSGSILPGHGGFLDRFDALLLGAPVAFAWLAIWIF